jgi:predicted  nucleic acid-binding Zn-ribbon protein
MPASAAENLRDLHALHERARALRSHLESGPKTLAARQAVLAARQAALEKARKDLKESKAHSKLKETQILSIKGKVDDLRTKLNAVKKQDEYNAIVSQIHSDNKNVDRLEGEVLEAMEAQDQQAKELAALESETKALETEVAALKVDLEARAAAQRAQLDELETLIAQSESIIPPDQRDQYRRVLKQRGADAMAAVEGGACHGCYVSVTAQMINELINGGSLIFCKTCGRILYLEEIPEKVTRRR